MRLKKMSSLSKEDMDLINLFASDDSFYNSPNIIENCKVLGDLIGRNWIEIHQAYEKLNLKQNLNNDETTKINEDMAVTNEDLPDYSKESQKNDDDDNCQVLESKATLGTNDFESFNIMNSIDNSGELDEFINIENFINNDTDTLANINGGGQTLETICLKRKHVEDLDVELIKTIIYQSESELELKKQEHEKKMKIYEMHLQHGAELHEEKMKILKEKLRVVKDTIFNYDWAISNKNLHKRFKSGPI